MKSNQIREDILYFLFRNNYWQNRHTPKSNICNKLSPVDCINKIKSVITEKRSIGYGNVCGISGDNQEITQINEAIKLDKGFQFVLNCESEAHLSQLEDLIKKELTSNEYICGDASGAEFSVENVMGIHELIFKEVVTQKEIVEQLWLGLQYIIWLLNPSA